MTNLILTSLQADIVNVIWLLAFIACVAGTIISITSYPKMQNENKWMARLYFVACGGGAVAIVRGVWGLF